MTFDHNARQAKEHAGRAKQAGPAPSIFAAPGIDATADGPKVNEIRTDAPAADAPAAPAAGALETPAPSFGGPTVPATPAPAAPAFAQGHGVPEPSPEQNLVPASPAPWTSKNTTEPVGRIGKLPSRVPCLE